jgi:hypothetical protein
MSCLPWILVAFVIAFTVFALVLYQIHPVVAYLSYGFAEKWFDNNTIKPGSIIILGSSQVKPLNTTLISQLTGHEVYNLAISGDKPSERVQMIDRIIKTNPALVVYGVSERDFASFAEQSYIQEWISPYITGLDFISQPQYDLLRYIQGNKSLDVEFLPYPNTPFITMSATNHGISNNLGEIHKHELRFDNIPPYQSNKDYLALKQILDKFKLAHIKYVVIVLPEQYLHIRDMNPVALNNFEEIVTQIDTPKLDLFERYENLNIWTDTTHVAIDRNALVFDYDVSNFIRNSL